MFKFPPAVPATVPAVFMFMLVPEVLVKAKAGRGAVCPLKLLTLIFPDAGMLLLAA